jgi:precorrin-2/cobalt-factor-2 C20-methyltransferase
MTIAKNHIPETTPIINLPFPMTKDKIQTQNAWVNHAHTIIDYLKQGKNAAFITLGDPTTYSTYGYILKNIQNFSPETPIKTIPGITSYQACSARLNTPLVEGEESLLITSGVQGGEHLRQLNIKPENIVFLKAYKNAGDIVLALEEADYINNSVGVRSCTLPEEEIINNVRKFKTRTPGYWTIILGKKNHAFVV